MQQADFLLTTAEIAIAFAAFASLVSVIGRGSPGPEQRIAAHRLLSVLVLSLLTLGLCLFPFPLVELGLPVTATLRWSSGVVLVPEVAATIYLIRAAPAGFHSQSLFPSVVWVVLATLGAGMLVAIASGWLGTSILAGYLAVILVHLAGAGQLFLLVAIAVLRRETAA